MLQKVRLLKVATSTSLNGNYYHQQPFEMIISRWLSCFLMFCSNQACFWIMEQVILIMIITMFLQSTQLLAVNSSILTMLFVSLDITCAPSTPNSKWSRRITAALRAGYTHTWQRAERWVFLLFLFIRRMSNNVFPRDTNVYLQRVKWPSLISIPVSR